MVMLFPNGLKSNEEKIITFFGADMPANAEIGDAQVQVRNGMAKLLGAYMIAIFVAKMLDATKLAEIHDALLTFQSIHSTWDGHRDEVKVCYAAIGTKNGRPVTQRMNPLQLLECLEPVTQIKKA